jgi:aryl-alcohol dehydrogenase-like predicted oxidoreductase
MNAIQGLPMSRLTLGTVQFGVPYGVANKVGQPSYQDVLKIVALALENRVNTFDTAAAYGTSEEVLGRALAELGALQSSYVVTKVPSLDGEQRSDPVRAGKVVAAAVEGSCRRLGLERIPLVLFHSEADSVALDALLEQVDRGLVGSVGVSCGNNPAMALRLVELPEISALQIPCSILDPRFPDSGLLARAAAKGVKLFVRSVYLQGLLVMPEESIPSKLRAAIPVRHGLENLAVSHGMSLAELALRYVLSLDGVASVITGVETRQQLLENIALFSKGPLPAKLVESALAIVPDLPEFLLTPAMWDGAWNPKKS